jgi:hypothetical protein
MKSVANDFNSVKSPTDRTPTDILQHLHILCGRCAVLLPVQFRQKGPQWIGWQTTTLERTRAPDYQQRLERAIRVGGNIGVQISPGLSHSKGRTQLAPCPAPAGCRRQFIDLACVMMLRTIKRKPGASRRRNSFLGRNKAITTTLKLKAS